MDTIRHWLERQDAGTVLVVGVVGTVLVLIYFLARLAAHPSEKRLDRIARALERRGRG